MHSQAQLQFLAFGIDISCMHCRSFGNYSWTLLLLSATQCLHLLLSLSCCGARHSAPRTATFLLLCWTCCGYAAWMAVLSMQLLPFCWSCHAR